jgi:hypothetical protein
MRQQKLNNDSAPGAGPISLPCRFFAELKEEEVKIKFVKNSGRFEQKDFSGAGLDLMSLFEGIEYRLTAR